MADRKRSTAPAHPEVVQLRYIGPDPETVGVVPLPEGWPATDHEEAEPARRAEKLASGKYIVAPAAASEEE